MAKQVTRNVGPLTTRAAFKPASVNAEKRTVDVVWSTGAKVLRNSFWDGPSYEELSMDPAHVRMGRLNNGAPFLADHWGSTDNVRGVVESARLENGQGIATVRFPTEGISPEADKMFALVRDGILQNISVGYRTYKTEKVEGGDAKIPTFRATDWEPYEISAVGMGADDQAGFRSADQQKPNPCVFETNEREDNVNEEEKKRLETEAAEKRAQELKAEATRAERERVKVLQIDCRGAKMTEDFTKKLIEDGVSVDAARALILAEISKRTENVQIDNHSPTIEVGTTDREKKLRGMEASLIARAGVAAMVAMGAASKVDHNIQQAFRGFDPRDNGGEYRAFTIVDLARELLEGAGTKTRGMTKERMVELALSQRATGENTQSDFAVLLENVMYKTLLGAYTLAPDTWRSFCKTDSVQDFRNSNRYRTGSFGVLDAVPEGEEYQNKSIPDGAKSTISASTSGNIIALSRQAMINDDLGAIAETAGKFGRMAGLTLEKAVYSLLAQNSGLGPTITYNGITAPLLDAQFANITTGAALSMAALEADRVKMGQQLDISGNEILDIKPSVLLVPLALGGEARVITQSKYDPTASSAFERPNIVNGVFKQVVDTARLTGTRRYIFADPGEAAAIVVAFLNGVQTPFMENRLGFRTDGMEWKIRLDYGVQGFDPKGIVGNAGV